MMKEAVTGRSVSMSSEGERGREREVGSGEGTSGRLVSGVQYCYNYESCVVVEAIVSLVELLPETLHMSHDVLV